MELQSASAAQDAFGEDIQTFSTYTTVWAMIEPLQGAELERAKQYDAEVKVKIRIRYNSSVSPNHRVKYTKNDNGLNVKNYEINAVINPEERNEELLLYCKEAA